MNDRAFLDSNILIYFYADDESYKRQIVLDILDNN